MSRQNETFPSAPEATLLVIALFVAEFLIGAALHDVQSLSGIDPRDAAGAIVVLGNGVLFSVLLHYKRMSYASLFHSSRTSVTAVLGILSVPILCIVPGLMLAVWAIQTVLVHLVPIANWQQAMSDRMMSNGLASIVTVCIIAPLLEEMLFRGIILRSFLHRYPRRQAILGSAVLFGLGHLNIHQFAVGVIVGCISGWLYERTRSLWPSVLLHAAYNSLAMAICFSITTQVKDEVWQPPRSLWITASMFAFFGTVLLRRVLAPGQEGS